MIDAAGVEDMDTQLVLLAQRGDEEAFASLAVAVGDRLHAVAHRILRDTDLAEDATQQALLSIWRDLPQLRDPARFDAWSYRLLVRACYSEGRRTRHWAPNLRLLPADEPVPGEGLGSVVDRDQLERGFRRLSIDHRSVVVLHHYLDMPLDEVAETLGVPVGDRPITSTSRDARPARGPRGRRATGDPGGDPMSTEPEVTSVVRSWLAEGADRMPDRVLDSVLDRLPTTPQRRPWWPARRFSTMSTPARLGIAAAAVAVVAIAGYAVLPRNASVGVPTPTANPSPRALVTPSPTAAPLEVPGAARDLGPGTYRAADPFAVPFTITFGQGWTLRNLMPGDVGFRKALPENGAVWINVDVPEGVYADPCQTVGGPVASPTAPTVDDLVAQLTSMRNFPAGPVSDIVIDGHPGKAFVVTNAIDTETAACTGGLMLDLYRVKSATGYIGAGTNGGATEHLFVVDVDGQPVIINAESFPGTPTADITEAEGIIRAMDFE